MKKRINRLLMVSLWLLLFIPSLAMAEKVSAEGESDYYYSGVSGERTAKYFATEKLGKLCKEKGLELYRGRLVKRAAGMEYSFINFSNLKCKTNSHREKKCTVRATAKCISKESKYFSLSCGKGKKKIKGRSEMIRGGGLRIFATNGTVYTISKQTVLADGGYNMLCDETADKSSEFIQYIKIYVRKKVKEHQRTCQSKLEKGGDVPAECQTKKHRRANDGSKG